MSTRTIIEISHDYGTRYGGPIGYSQSVLEQIRSAHEQAMIARLRSYGVVIESITALNGRQ